MKKLNLGCGSDYKNGWVNLDINKNVKADIYHNIEKFPYPFHNNSFDFVLLNMVLEHISSPIAVLEEVWRISKPNAMVKVFVPHWSSYLQYSDLTHKSAFSALSFHYFETGNPKYYSKSANFEVVKKRYNSFKSSKNKNKIFEWICSNIFEKLANINALVTEQVLCKFLPINEIEFELRVIK